MIQVFGLGGNDTLTLDEANGALPRANLFAGAGNDVATGGSGGDLIFGQAGNDKLLGKGGFDFLFGGDGNDVLTGGDADDQAFGEAGDDLFIWNPGDDTDLNEGGAGNDTSQVNGGGGAEVFTVTANGTRVRIDRVDPAPFSIDAGTIENVVINANGGDDSISATGDLASLIKLTVDGGDGNDKILGSNGNDTLKGGNGNDFIDGQQGNDLGLMGAGDDVFQWDPGDGNDTIEGQAGFDTMLFNGSGGNEIFDLSANGGRARFTRNLGNIVMDLNDVERVDLNALGGTDTITLNDMSGTEVKETRVDLAAAIGGTAGDGAADTVIVNANNAPNTIDVVGSGTSYTVSGLANLVSVKNSEGANDRLVINGLGGNDKITATALAAGVTKLTIDGGAGHDQMFGSQGDDVFLGGAGNDFILGDNGNDVAFMGAGNDTFQWNPGDGNDTLEGQDGFDTMLFNGANVAENIDISANGGRVTFFRNVANVTMDLNDVEKIDFKALGGVDNIVVGDLSGTDMKTVNLDLRVNGAGDGAADSVTVNATNGNDVPVKIATVGCEVVVSGLPAEVRLAGVDAGLDSLTVNGLNGDDRIDASGLQAGLKLTINGGLGVDTMIGGKGDDLFNGGDGNDVAHMGAGNDTFVWNPGDDNDTLRGQAGTDTMLFNGANAAENIDISASGGRAIFFRDVAAVTMDLDDVERIDFNALGGADNIVVKDLSSTDVEEVNLDLAAQLGGNVGDAPAVDTVTINGTNGNDLLQLSLVDGDLLVSGLEYEVRIENFDLTDVIKIVGLGGDDIVNASGLAGGPSLVFDGGFGDDVLLGSERADTMFGGAGNDVALGNGGDDVIDGGLGLDVLIGGAGTDVLTNGEVVVI